MPKCPNCQHTLTIRSIFSGGGLVCPHCHAELTPKPANSIVAILVGMGGGYLGYHGIGHLLQPQGIAHYCVVIAGAATYLVTAVALNASLARYRVKAPALSIR